MEVSRVGAGAPIAGVLGLLMMVFMMTVVLVPYIILLVTMWKAMRAHESVAESMKEIAAAMRAGLRNE